MDNSLNNIESLKKYKHIHMIGIGGISMSGNSRNTSQLGFFCYWF
jgi:UDP-N-acetylmuramate-alanine ligase